MSRRAVVIGAQGVLGALIARTFTASGWNVVRAGRRPESAADFRRIDLGDTAAVSRVCGEADLVVNTAHHAELRLERAVLRDGGVLIELIELAQADRARLLREEPGARGLVISDTGLGGVAYLALADLLHAHPDADQAEYSLMISAAGSTGRAGALFAHKLLTATAHHRTAGIPFPKPFGTRRSIEVGSDDRRLLRAAVNGVPIRHYLCMQPKGLHAALRALNSARLMSILPAASFTAGAGKVADEPSAEPICEWVGVARDGQRLAACTLQGRGYYRMTSAATLAFAEALMGSVDGKRGLLSIDELITLNAVRPVLQQHGIAVDKQVLDDRADGR